MVMDTTKSTQSPAADLALDIKLDASAAASAEDEVCISIWISALPPGSAASADVEVIDMEKTLAGGTALDFDFNIGAPTASKPAPQAEPDIDLGSISLDLGEPAAAACRR